MAWRKYLFRISPYVFMGILLLMVCPLVDNWSISVRHTSKKRRKTVCLTRSPRPVPTEGQTYETYKVVTLGAAHLWLDQYDEKKREPHMEWRCLLDQWFTRSSLLQVTSQVNACPAVRLQIKPRKRRKQMERLSGFFFLLFYLLDLLLLLVYTHMSLTGLNHKWNRYRFIKKPLVFQPPVGH